MTRKADGVTIRLGGSDSGDANRLREIAANLGISEGTVKTHVNNIMGKLGATDRTHAVTVALRRGFIRL